MEPVVPSLSPLRASLLPYLAHRRWLAAGRAPAKWSCAFEPDRASSRAAGERSWAHHEWPVIPCPRRPCPIRPWWHCHDAPAYAPRPKTLALLGGDLSLGVAAFSGRPFDSAQCSLCCVSTRVGGRDGSAFGPASGRKDLNVSRRGREIRRRFGAISPVPHCGSRPGGRPAPGACSSAAGASPFPCALRLCRDVPGAAVRTRAVHQVRHA